MAITQLGAQHMDTAANISSVALDKGVVQRKVSGAVSNDGTALGLTIIRNGIVASQLAIGNGELLGTQVDAATNALPIRSVVGDLGASDGVLRFVLLGLAGSINVGNVEAAAYRGTVAVDDAVGYFQCGFFCQNAASSVSGLVLEDLGAAYRQGALLGSGNRTAIVSCSVLFKGAVLDGNGAARREDTAAAIAGVLTENSAVAGGERAGSIIDANAAAVSGCLVAADLRVVQVSGTVAPQEQCAACGSVVVRKGYVRESGLGVGRYINSTAIFCSGIVGKIGVSQISRRTSLDPQRTAAKGGVIVVHGGFLSGTDGSTLCKEERTTINGIILGDRGVLQVQMSLPDEIDAAAIGSTVVLNGGILNRDADLFIEVLPNHYAAASVDGLVAGNLAVVFDGDIGINVITNPDAAAVLGAVVGDLGVVEGDILAASDAQTAAFRGCLRTVGVLGMIIIQRGILNGDAGLLHIHTAAAFFCTVVGDLGIVDGVFLVVGCASDDLHAAAIRAAGHIVADLGIGDSQHAVLHRDAAAVTVGGVFKDLDVISRQRAIIDPHTAAAAVIAGNVVIGNGGVVQVNGRTALGIDTAAARGAPGGSGCTIAADGAAVHSDGAATLCIDAAAIAGSFVSGNGAVREGDVALLVDGNAAAISALIAGDGHIFQFDVCTDDLHAAVGAAGDGTIDDLYLLLNGSLAVLAGGSVVLFAGQVHVHVAFDLLAIQVQLDPLGNFDIALVVLLQDDLITGLGIIQSIVQGAVAVAVNGGCVPTDFFLHAVHGGDACIRVLAQVVCVRLRKGFLFRNGNLRRGRGDLRRGLLLHHSVLSGGDLRRGLLFHYSVLSGGDLHRGLLLFLGSFLCGGQFHCNGGCFRSGRLRSDLCSGLSFRLFLCRQFGFRGFLRVGLGMINGSRSLCAGCVFRGLSIGGQRGGCHTGGQGQSHGGFFEFLVRHKIRSFRSAHKRYHKLYLYGDKTEQ